LKFVAIDFETANYSMDSACAVGLVRVENNEIVNSAYYLIRPPGRAFVNSYIHGLTWRDVKEADMFGDLWPEIDRFIEGVDFLAAHNASFDKRVLTACCEAYNVEFPNIPFICSVRVARKVWNIRPTRLPNVCSFLNIELDHHNAMSDAEACARIFIEANKKAPQVIDSLRIS